jgi:septal ring factor EnvC (AmiA/AmiB activator)
MELIEGEKKNRIRIGNNEIELIPENLKVIQAEIKSINKERAELKKATKEQDKHIEKLMEEKARISDQLLQTTCDLAEAQKQLSQECTDIHQNTALLVGRIKKLFKNAKEDELKTQVFALVDTVEGLVAKLKSDLSRKIEVPARLNLTSPDDLSPEAVLEIE